MKELPRYTLVAIDGDFQHIGHTLDYFEDADKYEVMSPREGRSYWHRDKLTPVVAVPVEDTPVFHVGDRVLDNRGELRTIEEYYEGMKQEDYVLARGGKFNDLGTFRVGQLTRIEESEEQSS